MSNASINIPPFDGTPRECGECWTLRKGRHSARCYLLTHPLGGEARIDVDGEMLRTAADRDGMALLALALEWEAQFKEKGWGIVTRAGARPLEHRCRAIFEDSG